MISLLFALSLQVSTKELPKDFVAALDRPERLLILKIDPEPEDEKGEAIGYNQVTGKTEIRHREAMTKIGTLIKAGVIPFNGAACFDPHDGVRIVAGKHRYDYLICFECGGLEIWRDGKRQMIYTLKNDVLRSLEPVMQEAAKNAKAGAKGRPKPGNRY